MASAAAACSNVELIPLLDYESIINAISEVSDGQVTVNVEELKKLKPQKAIAIYKALLFANNDFVIEELYQAQHRVMDCFRYPRLYEEAVSICTLAITLEKVMKFCGVNNFSMKDLLAPKPKRTHKLLSAFINYMQHCFSKENVVDSAINKNEEMKRRSVDLEEKKQNLISRIGELKAKRAEDQKMIAELTPVADTLQAKHNKMVNEQESRNKQLAEQARVAKEQSDTLDVLKIKDEMNETAAVGIERSSLLNRLSFKERQQADLEEDAKTACKLMNDLMSVLAKDTFATKSLVEVRDRVAIQQENIKDLLAQLQNIKRQKNSKHEKLTRLSIQHQKRLSAAIQLAEHEKTIRDAIKSDVAVKIKKQLDEVETEQREISELLNLQKIEFDRKMKKASTVYCKILDQMDVFHLSLTKGWEMITPFFTGNVTAVAEKE